MKNSIRFLPLLLLYIIIVLIASNSNFIGDEGRYVKFAFNLTKGYYSPSDPYRLDLWNGPGYPMVLLPFALFKLPWITAKLLNAFFLFGAVIYFYNTLQFYTSEHSARYLSFIFGIYPLFLRYIHRLLTEQLAVFLVCGVLFHFTKLHRHTKTSWIQILVVSLYLSYLALTKVLFGYVILICLILFLLVYLWKRKNTLKKVALIYLFALIWCTPYLVYTYSLTGKIFYWSNGGGIALYVMSSIYEDELGDLRVPYVMESENHQKFFAQLREKDLTNVQWDEAVKKKAIENIIGHPVKYLKNWIANIGRLLFNYPYSYTPQKLSTYFYLIPNMFLVAFAIVSIYFSFIGRRLIPPEIYYLLIFALIAFGGSSLVYGENRYFTPLVPVFTLWISFTLTNIVKIEAR